MGRNNSDFYHGSNYPFQPGEVVEPRGKFPVAYASTQKNVAAGYGDKVYRVEPLGDVERQPGAAKEFGIHYSRTGFRVLGQAD